MQTAKKERRVFACMVAGLCMHVQSIWVFPWVGTRLADVVSKTICGLMNRTILIGNRQGCHHERLHRQRRYSPREWLKRISNSLIHCGGYCQLNKTSDPSKWPSIVELTKNFRWILKIKMSFRYGANSLLVSMLCNVELHLRSAFAYWTGIPYSTKQFTDLQL